MQLADDLLFQAGHLASLDPRRPKQANLRRAVSSAYYAIFHFLSDEVVRLLIPTSPSELATHARRALGHTPMRKVCEAVVDGRLARGKEQLLPVGFSAEFRQIAKAFVDLQEARHLADYDLGSPHDRASVLLSVEQAREAITSWRAVRGTDEAHVFLTALLLGDRWSR